MFDNIVKVASKVGIKANRFYEACAEFQVASSFRSASSPPCLIYQMGKVGSSTVYSALKSSNPPFAVLHIHFLSNDLPELFNSFKKAGLSPLPYHLYVGQAVRRYLQQHPGQPLNVISLVRDPVAFAISDLFQNPKFFSEALDPKTGKICPQRAVDFLNRALGEEQTFSYVYEWFDRELKTVFGIDVFAEKFAVDKGYGLFEKDNVRALVFQLEALSSSGERVVSEFLKLKKMIEFRPKNVRSGNSDYLEVLGGLSVDQKLCEHVYNSHFVQHFYGPENIKEFQNKWVKCM